MIKRAPSKPLASTHTHCRCIAGWQLCATSLKGSTQVRRNPVHSYYLTRFLFVCWRILFKRSLWRRTDNNNNNNTSDRGSRRECCMSWLVLLEFSLFLSVSLRWPHLRSTGLNSFSDLKSREKNKFARNKNHGL